MKTQLEKLHQDLENNNVPCYIDRGHIAFKLHMIDVMWNAKEKHFFAVTQYEKFTGNRALTLRFILGEIGK